MAGQSTQCLLLLLHSCLDLQDPGALQCSGSPPAEWEGGPAREQADPGGSRGI